MTALYVHLPFCQRKCFYCSFVVSVAQLHRADRYVRCLLQEARQYKKQSIGSVYFGGGTPTMLDGRQLRELVHGLQDHFLCDEKTEFTIEANPEDVTPAKTSIIRELGVNRISLGVQSFHDKYLSYLGRCHDARRAVEAFGMLRDAGFKNLSVDLMYAFPEQTKEEIAEDVRQLTQLNSEHVSLYTLTVEERSRFYARRIKEQKGPVQARHYRYVIQLLEKQGHRQYEVSNFCRQGYESVHNKNYWTGGDYIGLGVGAHSHAAGRRYWNVSRLDDYIGKVEADESPCEGEESLTPDQRLTETMCFGLRMNEGVDIAQLEEMFGIKLARDKREAIAKFVGQGLLSLNGDRLKTTLPGRLVLDEVCARLI